MWFNLGRHFLLLTGGKLGVSDEIMARERGRQRERGEKDPSPPPPSDFGKKVADIGGVAAAR